MPTRGLSGTNSCEFERNCLAIEHCHQPAHRAHETLTGLAPIHILGPVDARDFFGKSFGQDFGRGAPFLRDLCGEVLALCGGDSFQPSDVDSGLPGKGVGGGCGLAVFVRDVDGWSGDLFDDIGLGGSDARGHDSQAAGSLQRGDFSSGETLASKQRAHAFAQFLGGRIDHAGRNFFATNL